MADPGHFVTDEYSLAGFKVTELIRLRNFMDKHMMSFDQIMVTLKNTTHPAYHLLLSWQDVETLTKIRRQEWAEHFGPYAELFG